MKARISLIAALAVAAAAFAVPANAGPTTKKTKIDTPNISCGTATNISIQIHVCAPGGTGATGLPAGFSIQWTTQAILDANSGIWPATDGVSACGASFAGKAFGSTYNLAAGQCITVEVGDFLFDSGASTNCPNALNPCTQYVFRAFGHATSTLNRSDNTPNLQCSTTGCNTSCDPCVHSQGYYRNHPETLPATLTMGCQTYTAADLLTILQTSAGGTNGLIELAHQVITTKLNMACGAGSDYLAAVGTNLSDAEVLMCTTGAVPPIGTGSLPSSQTGPLTDAVKLAIGSFDCSP